MANKAADASRIDFPTLIGLGLLLAPLTTMWHEIVGHGGMCMATGGRLTQIGAYYVECVSRTVAAGRLVAMAGVWADVIAAIAAALLWRRAQGPLPRLLLWTIATTKAFCAAGYFLFSGLTNVGDYAPAQGLAPLAHPWAWRAAFVMAGGIAYWRIIGVASGAMGRMVGDDRAARRRMALGLYFTFGAVALIVGAFNPVGFFIILMSAMASSFGGNAGLWPVAYDRRAAGPAAPFVLPRNNVLIGAGLLVAVAFAALLGPTIMLS
jgi:hypothetical protein